MKLLIIAALFSLTSFIVPQKKNIVKTPLSEYSEAWNNPRFLECNTAINADYLSTEEKEMIYVTNMMRMDPQLFGNTVVKQFPDKEGVLYYKTLTEYKSLLKDLAKSKPLPLLYPDKRASESAKCHAISSGEKSYVGHVRQNEKCKKIKFYDAECCDYGRYFPLDILIGQLVDEGVEGLGHRYAFLTMFTKLGVSIQPHKGYGRTAVFDFLF